jgi:molybdopterin-binding protein
MTMSISARNKLKGKITEIVLGDVMAEITIRVGQNIIDAGHYAQKRGRTEA